MTGSMRSLVALAVAGLACDSAPSPPPPTAAVATEASYRVVLDTTSPISAASAGRLRLRVEPRKGWHLAPEAPVRLELESPGGVAFAPARLTNEDALSLERDLLEFETQIQAERPGSPVVRALLKFGICEDPNETCMIIRRELEIPLAIAFTP